MTEQLEAVNLFMVCLEIAHKRGIDTESAIRCEGEQECDDCPYNFNE